VQGLRGALPSPSGPIIQGQQGPYGGRDPRGPAQSLRAIFDLLQGGHLEQGQVARLGQGQTPGGFHGAFTNLSPAQLRAIGAMMALQAQGGRPPGVPEATDNADVLGGRPPPGVRGATDMGGYGIQNGLGQFLHAMMMAGGQRTGGRADFGPYGGQQGRPAGGPGPGNPYQGYMPPGRMPMRNPRGF
jgi:hypothetical protein